MTIDFHRRAQAGPVWAPVKRRDTREQVRHMRIAIVIGTRPEIIKMMPIIEHLGAEAELIYTGQHYDEMMAGVFFDAFGMSPTSVLQIGNLTRGEQIGTGTTAISKLFCDAKPRAVVVQGDTNSALAGALAANATETPLVHVEAGLRSFDRAMPEEHNRVLIDHVSDLLLAPTAVAETNLHRERCAGRIEVTGNTVVEAVTRMLPDLSRRRQLLASYGLVDNEFVLATIHRPENTDDPRNLHAIFTALQGLDVPVLLPLHPRTRMRLRASNLENLLDNLRVIEPIGYPDFLALAAHARLLISDSGGVQEEVSVLKRRAVVVRRSTERPEALGTFTVLCEPAQLGDTASEWVRDSDGRQEFIEKLRSPYGDGDAGLLSVKAIHEVLK